MSGPALGADGPAYAASNAGLLHALDPATSADRLVFDRDEAYGSDLSTPPAILGHDPVAEPDQQAGALDPPGHLRWRQSFGGFVLSPADRGDRRIYVMDLAGTLNPLDVGPKGHSVAWATKLGSSSCASPAIAPDGGVVTALDAKGCRGDGPGRSRRERWWQLWQAPATIKVSPVKISHPCPAGRWPGRKRLWHVLPRRPRPTGSMSP